MHGEAQAEIDERPIDECRAGRQKITIHQFSSTKPVLFAPQQESILGFFIDFCVGGGYHFPL